MSKLKLGLSRVPVIQSLLTFFRGDQPLRRRKTLVLMSLLIIGQFLASCGGNTDLVSENGSESLMGPKGSQTGMASWYGPGFYGNRTASGEIFRPGTLTAAHRHLPFGTMLCVTNLWNGQIVQVRINDRGPFSGGRIIDLSEYAAGKIGMKGSGVANVRLTPGDKGCTGAPKAQAVAVDPKVECPKGFITELVQDASQLFIKVTKAKKCTATKVVPTFVDQTGTETPGSEVIFQTKESVTVQVPLPVNARSVRVDLMRNSEVYASSKPISLESVVTQESEKLDEQPTAPSPQDRLEAALSGISPNVQK